jgi:predicted ATPase
VVQYLKLAADKALQRFAYQEAIGHLGRGLAVLPRLPETLERTKWELDIQITLRQALTVTQGPGTPAVARVYARAEKLCQQVGDIRQRIAVLRGLRRATQGRGEPKEARPLAEEFLRLAQQVQDATLLIEGHVALGICLFYLGNVTTAHIHLEEGLAIFDPQRPQVYLFPTGQDLRVLGLAYDAMALWVSGYPEQALERSLRAMKLAEDVAQPWTRVMALGYTALIHVLRGDRQAALTRAGATIQLATEQGISPWVGQGMMLRGWSLVEQGQRTEGLAQMRQGLTIWQTNGQELGKPFWLALLGECSTKMGEVEEGLQVLAEAMAMAQRRELRVWEAELQRLQGELLLQQAVEGMGGSSPADAPQSASTGVQAIGQSHRLTEAEICFRHALEITRAQQWSRA